MQNDLYLSEFEKGVALKIIKVLSYRSSYTKKHCHVETLISGFPPEDKGLALAAIDYFLKRGWLEKYSTSHGFQVKLTKEGAKKFWPIMQQVEAEKMKEFGLSRILKCLAF